MESNWLCRMGEIIGLRVRFIAHSFGRGFVHNISVQRFSHINSCIHMYVDSKSSRSAGVAPQLILKQPLHVIQNIVWR